MTYPTLIVALCLAPLSCSLPATAVPLSTQQQQQAQKSGDAPDSGQQKAPADEKLSLSDQIIQGVLEPLRTGMETQNVQQVLALFDKQEFSNYSDLQGQLRAFFQQFAEVRFRYQILQATAENDHGSATAELDMDALPYEATVIPVRRSVQVRFQLKLEPKGWKIVGFSPSDFFGLGYSRADAEQGR